MNPFDCGDYKTKISIASNVLEHAATQPKQPSLLTEARNQHSGSQPKVRPSTERVRKLTAQPPGAPFWASATGGRTKGRGSLSPCIGHFKKFGRSRCQPERGENS
jgi:hypothetical protein